METTKSCDMLVSIIIPVFNVAEYIGACLESCINQTYRHIEIVVVDDGSTDSSGGIADDYALRDSRVLVYHQINKGVVEARELGILKSKGEYLCFVDGDDFLGVDMISTMMNNIDTNDIATCGFYIYDDCTNKVKVRNNYYIGPGRDDIVASLLQRKCTWSLCGKLFKRYLFNNIQMPYGVKIGEDGIVCFQLHNNARFVTSIDTPFYYYRQRASSVTHKKHCDYTVSIVEFIQNIMRLDEHYGWTNHSVIPLNTFVLSQIFVYYMNNGELSFLSKSINVNFSVNQILSCDLTMTEKIGLILFLKMRGLGSVLRYIYGAIKQNQ